MHNKGEQSEASIRALIQEQRNFIIVFSGHHHYFNINVIDYAQIDSSYYYCE